VTAVVRQNERSWAIEIISEINLLLRRTNLRIKRAGGESTLSENKKSMFPDILLYADEDRTKILQSWELKMPDVLITNQEFIADATRKANALALNSFVLWNFTYGKLYVKDSNGNFVERKTWPMTSHITSRNDVIIYKHEWVPIIEDIIIEVNQYLLTDEIAPASIIRVLSDNLMTAIIDRNKKILAAHYRDVSSRNMEMEQRIKVWWFSYKEDYTNDEDDAYSAYSKTVLLNWTNRIVFANIIKRYHNSANQVREIDYGCSPSRANQVMENIIRQGDYYNVFQGLPFNDLLPDDTWVDIVDFNQFVDENGVRAIEQSTLQDVLEKTVDSAKREMRGQFATPDWLADFLCQITIRDWSADCADLCAGTGTIAKAIIQNKNSRRYSVRDNLATTWISDKYAYPLQIANIALTNSDSINMAVNIFQKNVFDLHSGDNIIIKSPVDGSDIVKPFPPLHAVISNLPFVQSRSIGADDISNMNRVIEEVKRETGLDDRAGRLDLYMVLPFKIHGLLQNGGRLGIVISNAWLGTETGRFFFDALIQYFKIHSVILSGAGRWFTNASVVATILILERKEIGKPADDETIDFCLIKRELNTAADDMKENLIGSIVLKEKAVSDPFDIGKYSIAEINSIKEKGLSLNALFHDATWITQISDKLIRVTDYVDVFRGERRGWDDLFFPDDGHGIEKEYIKSVLKSSRQIQKYTAAAEGNAFCCGRSLEELRELNHFGAAAWIEKFNQINNGVGRPLPEVLKRSDCHWYEMKDISHADFVTSLNPGRRLFFAKLAASSFINQRLIGLQLKKGNKDLLHALLNTVFEMFTIEGLGFGRGLGALDMSKDNFEKTYILNPELISETDIAAILGAFECMKSRNVLSVEDELASADREKFDRLVLGVLGIEDYYERIKESVLSMQRTRLSVRL
jgi:hypothetical protein